LSEQIFRTERLSLTAKRIARAVIVFAAGCAVLIPILIYRGVTLSPGNKTRNSDGTWLRIKVNNSGPRDAKCRVYLLKLTRAGLKEPLISDQYLLLWSNAIEESNLTQAVLIPGGTFRHFNIAMVLAMDAEKNIMSIPSSEWTSLLEREPLIPGDYKFFVQANGADCGPTSTSFWVRYEGGNKIDFVPGP
jgi:hypothetical protein